MIPPRLIPNFGAESGNETPKPSAQLDAVLGAWRALFYTDESWPDRVTPWLSTTANPDPDKDPDLVRAFTDKARALTYADDPATNAALVLDDALPSALPALPDWASNWTLKPRFSSSGRGRSRVNSLDDLVRAWPRLRARGGAILEPWCARALDLSAAGRVHDDGRVELLGTCRLDVTPSGVPRGIEGTVRAGVITAGTRYDDAVAEAALRVGADLARAGVVGAFGVDAFVFRADRERLRVPVEVNPRWTLGVIACCLARARLTRGDFRLGFGAPRGATHARWGDFTLSFTSRG